MPRFWIERTYPGDETDYESVLFENGLCISFILADKYLAVNQEAFFVAGCCACFCWLGARGGGNITL